VLAIASWTIAVAPTGVRADEPMPIPVPCAEPSEPVAFDTEADAEARLVGTWIRCESASPMFSAEEGEHVGIEFAADGRFFRVYQDADGALIRAEGLLQEGRWEVQSAIATDAMLSMELIGAGFNIHEMTVFDAPEAMQLTDAMTRTIRDYARWSGAAPVPGWPAGVGEGPCSIRTLPVALDSAADAQARLVGTWIRCEDTRRMFWAHEGEDVGFEFSDDGTFDRIYRGPDGGLIRAEGLVQQGRWAIDDVDESAAGLGMKLLGSGYFGILATFHEPDALRFMDGMDGTTIHYFRWAGAAPEPGLPAGVGEGPCGHATNPVVLESSDQAEQLLTGTWTVCAGDPFGPGVIGAEFAADGSFRELVYAADGQVVRTPQSVGATWSIEPFDEPFDMHNEPQVVVHLPDDGGTRGFSPSFFTSPPFIAFMGVDGSAGLIAGAPTPLPQAPSAIPMTGADRSLDLAIVAGALMLIGSASLCVARRARRAG
jgi:hypothetical protein